MRNERRRPRLSRSLARSGTFALVTCFGYPAYESATSLDLVDLRTGVTTHIGTFDQTIDSRFGGATPFVSYG